MYFDGLRQRFLKNALLGGDFDQRAYAFDVKIGVAIQNALFQFSRKRNGSDPR